MYCKFCSWIKIGAITESIKKVIQCLRTREKKDGKLDFLANAKGNTIESLTSNVLINQNISHYELVSMHDMFKEFNDIKMSLKIIKALILFFMPQFVIAALFCNNSCPNL